MNPIISRRILQTTGIDAFNGIPKASPAAAGSPDASVTRLFDPSKPLDSTMALIIVVLVTALVFVAFFSVYIRRHFVVPDSPPTRRLSKAGGLDSAAVKSLPLISYAEHRIMIDDCPICLTEFREGETLKLIPYCGHVFHPTCLDTWLASHLTCPLCRFAADKELCLDVAPDNCAAAAERSDTWRRPDGGVRRACSCCNVANQAVLQRSASF